MKYNEKYDRYVDDDFVVYRLDKNSDKLVQVMPQKSKNGYICISCVLKNKVYTRIYLHRFLWETFKGEIPQGYEIDHFDRHRDNNVLNNLRLCTHKENMNNPNTRKHISEIMKGKQSPRKGVELSEKTKRKISESNRGMVRSEFGKKYIEHYGYGKSQNIKQYDREYSYYKRHNDICSWEIENADT